MGVEGREREKEHGWCFAARSFLIDESGPRGALKANRYSFFFLPPVFFLPIVFFLTVRFVADSDKMMAEQNKRGVGVEGCVWRGHPLITSLWGFQKIALYVCFCRCVCVSVCRTGLCV